MAVLLDPAPDANEPAFQRLGIAGACPQKLPIATAERDRERPAPVLVEVQIDNPAAPLSDPLDPTFDNLEGAAVAREL